MYHFYVWLTEALINLTDSLKFRKTFCLVLLNVVYKIDCKDCDASYVGQTGRCLKTRINEHKNHINRNTTQHSVITQHRIDLGHDFNWDKVHILDKEQILHKRLLSEMIHIKRQKQGLNLQNSRYTFFGSVIY